MMDGFVGRRDFLKTFAVLTGGGIATSNSILEGKTQSANSSNNIPWVSGRGPGKPSRLSDLTHQLAQKGLSGQWSHQLISIGAVPTEQLAGLGPQRRYGAAALHAAKHCPIRIDPGQQIVGSATLKEAPSQVVPCFENVSRTSHTTAGWHQALQIGYKGCRTKIHARIERGGPFFPTAIHSLQSITFGV